MKSVGRAFAVLCAGVALAFAGCAPPAPVSDARIMTTFQSDRQGFNQAVAAMTTPPVISRIEDREQGVSTDPTGLDPARVASLKTFMRRHGIEAISASPDGGTVIFHMSTSGLDAPGQRKSLFYSRLSYPDWTMVPDTEQAMAKPSDHWRVVHRDLGDDWYLQNSCC